MVEQDSNDRNAAPAVESRQVAAAGVHLHVEQGLNGTPKVMNVVQGQTDETGLVSRK